MKPAAAATERRPARRVREDARDAAALMLFSGAVALALAVALVVIGRLGPRG